MYIRFSPNLVKGMALYLGIPVKYLIRSRLIPYSTVYIYKVLSGEVYLNGILNKALNNLWEQKKLTAEDLENIYKLIDLLEVGSNKQKQIKLAELKASQKK